MKRFIVCLIACASISLMFYSCSKDEASFDQSLLIGTWKQVDGADTYYYKYIAGNTGKYWYNDLTENQARSFTWTLNKADLTITHQAELGSTAVPEYYTVTALSSTTLTYKDNSGSYTLTKM